MKKIFVAISIFITLISISSKANSLNCYVSTSVTTNGTTIDYGVSTACSTGYNYCSVSLNLK